MAKVLKPNIAINAVYDDPPASPTEEQANATIKKRTARKYGDRFVMSIVILISCFDSIYTMQQKD